MASNYLETWWGRRWFVPVVHFDPREGVTVVEPPGSGPGYWAGAASVLYDCPTCAEAPPPRASTSAAGGATVPGCPPPDGGGTFSLYYRLRRPREEGRGYVCRVAQSKDGVEFATVWEARREEFASPSVERAALVATPAGRFRLYLSLVDGTDGRWKVEVMEARSPAEFRPGERQRVLDPVALGLAGVKDPYVMVLGGLYWALLSYAPLPQGREEAALHATGDVYATGRTTSHTGLATSADGFRFDWQGDVFSPVPGRWDAYAARIGTVVPAGAGFLAFYDGGASVEENYEEKCGLAVTLDLRHFHRVSVAGPFATSPHASRSLRYLDAVVVGKEVCAYYEYARPDGSHELRMSRLRLGPGASATWTSGSSSHRAGWTKAL